MILCILWNFISYYIGVHSESEISQLQKRKHLQKLAAGACLARGKIWERHLINSDEFEPSDHQQPE